MSDDLVAEVFHAFSKVSRPTDDALTSCDCEECRWEVAGFRGKTWPRLNLVDHDYDNGHLNFNLLTPQAFHYFLPSLLLTIHEHPEAGGVYLDLILSELTVSDNAKDDPGRANRIVRQLSSPQRQVLFDFLIRPEFAESRSPAWESALSNLRDAFVKSYSFEAMTEWVAKRIGRQNGDAPPSTPESV